METSTDNCFANLKGTKSENAFQKRNIM
jgi:hypothetical protein